MKKKVSGANILFPFHPWDQGALREAFLAPFFDYTPAQVRVLQPSATHFQQVMALMEAAMGSGALVADAALASYAIQYKATLYSNDADFSRFAGLSWRNPLQ